MSLLSLFRGTTSEVNARTRKDGQLLVDTEAGAVKVDVAQSGIINRITVSGSGGTSSQSDFAETDSTKASYIKHKPTNTSDFIDTLFIYGNTEPTTDLVDGKTEWIGGDGRVELTFINMDGSTYMTYLGHSGDEFPEVEDPELPGYRFSNWSPSLPSVIPNVDTTYIAEAVGMVTLSFYGQYNELVQTVQALPGDPFPTIEDPVSPDGSAEFKRWIPTLPSTVPNSSEYYNSDWDRYTHIIIRAIGDNTYYPNYYSNSTNILNGYYKPGTAFPSYTLPNSVTIYPFNPSSQSPIALTQHHWENEPPSVVPAYDGYEKVYNNIYDRA